jgi:hypothetical protein
VPVPPKFIEECRVKSIVRTLLVVLPASRALLGVLVAAVALSAAAPVTSLAAPEPEPIPRRWQLRLQPGDLRVASFETSTGPRTFLYMTFKVTNTSGEDRDLAPSFELATDTGIVMRSGRNVPREVVEALLARTNNPLLTDEMGVQGRLLQGEENAREGLVVWPADDLQASEYTVFCMGFSGETKAVKRPDTGETVVLRKTLMLRHDGTGRLDPTSGRPLPRAQERWILR